MCGTVDGSEIRRSPVEVLSLSHYLQGFKHPRWLFGISEPSTVVSFAQIPSFPAERVLKLSLGRLLCVSSMYIYVEINWDTAPPTNSGKVRFIRLRLDCCWGAIDSIDPLQIPFDDLFQQPGVPKPFLVGRLFFGGINCSLRFACLVGKHIPSLKLT